MEKLDLPTNRNADVLKEKTVENITDRKFRKKDFEYEEVKEEEIEYYVYPNYRTELAKHRIPVVPDMQDTELTNFMTRVANEDDTKKTVTAMMRIRNSNRINPNKGKKVEYLVWYEQWQGFDKNNNEISVGDLPQGLDKTSLFSRRVDGQGREHFKHGNEYWFYTVPFHPETVDKILESTGSDPESISYTCQGVKSWGGYSFEEFRNCTFEELAERGRSGKVQQKVVRESKEKEQVIKKK